MPKKRIAKVADECVSCGSCLSICPVDAISIPNGIRAEVDPDKCVGCGKCEKTCPAGVIVMRSREDTA